MNDKIEFRFVTRTVSNDYHVFANDGDMILSDNEDFAPIRAKSEIISEGGGCAVLFEDKAKIFLIASGIPSGRNDVFGRTIRFSFCNIFQNIREYEKSCAYNAFSKIIREWNMTCSKIQNLFKERSDGSVSFEHNIFMKWLQEGHENINFDMCRHGDIRPVSAYIWPSNGCLLKWILSEDDCIVCMQIINI